MPIRSITELVASEACTTWLAIAARPPEPSTAENASSTGRPAATKAPKAISRTAKVIGSDSFSARESPELTVFLTSRSPLASPNSCTSKAGAARRSEDTADSTGGTRSGRLRPAPSVRTRRAPSVRPWRAVPSCRTTAASAVRDLGHRPQARHDGRQLPPVAPGRSAQRAALYEHRPRLRVRRSRPFPASSGLVPPDPWTVPVGELDGPGGAAGGDRGGDQGEPPEGGGLPVCGTPASRTGGDVHGVSLRLPVIHRQLRHGERPRQCGALVRGMQLAGVSVRRRGGQEPVRAGFSRRLT